MSAARVYRERIMKIGYLCGAAVLILSGLALASPKPDLSERELADIRTAMHQRPAWEAELDLPRLAAAPFPKLVVSGGRMHLPEKQRSEPRVKALLAVCDHLTAGLNAQRAIFDKAAHNPQIEMTALFNLRLRAFLEDVSAAAP